MAVVTAGTPGNEKQGTTEAARPSTGAPAIGLAELFQKCASQGGWSGAALEYLVEIRKILEDPSKSIKATMQYISDVAVAFLTPDKYAIVLVRDDDVANVQVLLSDAKFYAAFDAFKNESTLNGYKLLNIVSCNRFMFNRHAQMAEYITQAFMAQRDETIRGFNVDWFGNRYQINIDTEMANVRQFFEIHSPNPTISGDFGFIASIVDKSKESPYGQYQSATPMFGVTGYVEFIRNPRDGRFTPMVHVTDILSILASPKILALALPLIGDVFINRALWRQPLTALGKTDINIGNLIVDNGKPCEVKSEIDLRKLFNEYINEAILCVDVRSGHTSIPGFDLITRPADHDILASQIFEFLNLQPVKVEGIGENCSREIVGYIESSKTGKFSNIMDTRDVTYLWAVSKLKYSPKLEMLLARNDIDPIRRFDAIREIVGEVTPVYASITTLLYGNFIKQIAATLATKVLINNPQIVDMPSIDLTNLAAKSYQGGMPIFGQASPGNIVGAGYLRSF